MIAGLLVDRGHEVLVTDLDEASAVAAAEELGPRASARALDVRDEEAVDAARDELVARAGRLGVWVNNAGVLATGSAWEQDAGTRRLMLEVNALGTINGTVSAIAAILCPSCMRPLNGSVHMLAVGDMPSTNRFSSRSFSRMPRNICSMVLAPSSPGVAPCNRSPLPPGTSSPSVVRT